MRAEGADMQGVAATSWSPERVDLFYLLDPGSSHTFAMNHISGEWG